MRTALAALIAALSACSCPQQAAAQTAREKADFDLIQSIGSRKAYEAFLSTYPNGHYADIARKRIQEMTPPAELAPKDRRLEPNWGDGMFIDRLMQKQR
jgi:hypothetical protein